MLGRKRLGTFAWRDWQSHEKARELRARGQGEGRNEIGTDGQYVFLLGPSKSLRSCRRSAILSGRENVAPKLFSDYVTPELRFSPSGNGFFYLGELPRGPIKGQE